MRAQLGCLLLCSGVSADLFQLPLVPHHAQQHRRQLRSIELEDGSQLRRRQDAVQVGALYQGYGTHYVDLWVGSPPQRQTLIVDTGSGVTAFPCSACTECGKGHHIDDYFDEHQSSSFTQVPCGQCQRGQCHQGSNQLCNIGMSYQEGSSWSAFEAKDMCYIGGPHSHPLLQDNGGDQDLDPGHAKAFSFEMTFGCQTKLTGLFKTQLADGIMGMDNAATAFWAQMFNHKLMDSKTFSLCFTRQPMADRQGNEAGAMTMGGYDERLHRTPMVYSSNREYNGGFFSVRIRKVYLRDGAGGESAKATDPLAKLITLNIAEKSLNAGNVIVDSGTTDTYFTRRIGAEFKNAYEKLTGKAYSHAPVALSPDDLKALPTILIQIAGDKDLNEKLHKNPTTVSGLAGEIDHEHPYDILLAIPPSHYMEFDKKKGKHVARFYTDEVSGSVIGANAMMGHDVFFDIDKRRIGWAESDCNYVQLIENAGFDKEASSNNVVEGNANRDERPPVEESSSQIDETEGLFPPNTDGSSRVHPAVAACSDLACRGGIAAVLVAFLLVGAVLGRSCSRKPNSGNVALELREISTGILPMNKGDLQMRYKDDPDNDEGWVSRNENGHNNRNSYRDEPPTPSVFAAS